MPRALVLAKLLLHAPLLSRYGWHPDELYFLSCGRRLAFGYADHPPFTPWVARLAEALFGDSLVGLRLFPLLAGVLLILLACRLVRELGGGAFAQGVAGLCLLTGPVWLRTSNMLTIVSFEPLFWTGCALLLVRLLRGGDPRLWLAFGAVAGVGVLNKHTVLLFGGALVLGLLLTRQRGLLRSRWPWLGLLVCSLCFLPNLAWQASHDWATFRFMRALNESVMSGISPVEFLAGQVIYVGPLAAIVWLPGLARLFSPRHRELRPLAWGWVLLITALLLLSSKVYYSMPYYPILLAAGAWYWEDRLAHARTRRCVVVSRVALGSLLLAGGAALAPVSLPLLPIAKVDGFARAATLGLVASSGEVTGDLHAQHGWPELAAEVAKRLEGLSDVDRGKAVLFVRNYGEAGALEQWGARYGLPPVITNHLSWHDWLPASISGEVVLTLGLGDSPLDELYEEKEPLGVLPDHPQGASWERGRELVLYRRPKVPLARWWPAERWL